MLDLFQTMDNCGGIGPVVLLIKVGIYPLIQIGIPIILILMGTIDLGKAVLSNDDKEIKGATSKLVKRAIAAVAVFFVATLVSVVMGWLGKVDKEDENNEYGATDWSACWNNPMGTDSSDQD